VNDEVENVIRAKFHVRSNTKIESFYRTMSGLTGHYLASVGTCPAHPDLAPLHPESLYWTLPGATRLYPVEPDIV
jgi:hypothetical protein